MSRPLQAIELLLNSARGRCIPRDFVQQCAIGGEDGWQGITDDDIKDLSDPDNEWYWEAWEDVMNKARFISKCGKEYTLHQDGDLFAVCFEELDEDQRIDLGWEL